MDKVSELMLLKKSQDAHDELKEKIVKLMWEFTDKYASKGVDCLYPYCGHVLVAVLEESLDSAKNVIKG